MTASAPARSATGDLWSGVKSAATSPVAAAEASAAGQSGGIGTGVVAGLAILAVGIAGLAGGFIVTTMGRRRVAGSARRKTTNKR